MVVPDVPRDLRQQRLQVAIAIVVVSQRPVELRVPRVASLPEPSTPLVPWRLQVLPHVFLPLQDVAIRIDHRCSRHISPSSIRGVLVMPAAGFIATRRCRCRAYT